MITVRETNWAGPCIGLGPLRKETPQFYVYGYGKRGERVSKNNPAIHLEPCRRCGDHPETEYPRGYEG